MQAANRRFKARREHGRTIRAADSAQQLLRDEAKPRDVDPIAGREQHMVIGLGLMEWMPPPDGIECAKVVMFSHPTNGESIHGKG